MIKSTVIATCVAFIVFPTLKKLQTSVTANTNNARAPSNPNSFCRTDIGSSGEFIASSIFLTCKPL